jgi:hypothetical protein
MQKFIDKINGQDYETRKRWLITLSSISCLIIFALWFASASFFKSNPLANLQEPTSENENASANTFSSLLSKVSETWNKTKESFSGATVEFERVASSSESITEPTSTSTN